MLLEAPSAVKQLLGRSLQQSFLDVGVYLQGKSVLVTGAGGSIGSQLCLQILAMKPRVLVLYEMSEYFLYQIDRKLQSLKTETKIVPILGNLSSSAQLQRLMTIFHVRAVFHAAAYKHVPLVERNSLLGIANNVFGTKHLVDAARDCGIEDVIVVSTDKAVNPTNVMGASKRLAEYVALAGRSPYKVVRFGNVLWSAGSVLPLFYEQLLTTKVLTITHPEVTRFFMSIEEAVALILQTTLLPHEICVLDMGSPVNIADMARRFAELLEITDYTVEYIGLRPGEKLFEELTLGDDLIGTTHSHIKAAKEVQPLYEDLAGWLRSLELMCELGEVGEVRKLLSTIIPGYQPSCGIVDDVWLEKNVFQASNDLKQDDCFWRAQV